LIELDQQHLITSYDTWHGGEAHAMSYAILNRRHLIDPITENVLGVRLKMKTSWQWPALVIRPFHAWHVESMVASDPLYFADTDSDLLAVTESWFTPDYQRRLCKYQINEQSQQMLAKLPDSQFGLVYAAFFLNFRPIEIIKQYLAEILSLLRPGGYFVFTFNNCDTVSGAQLFERFAGSYTPGRLVKQEAEKIGYEIVYEFSDAGATSWLELRKPGKLDSIRAGQTLALIKNDPSLPPPPVPDYKPPEPSRGPPLDIDPHDDPMYNEVNILLDICKMLGIDTNTVISKGQPSVKKMRKVIAQHLHTEKFPAEKISRLLEKRKKS
jgi:SAM-dependent methyltransferase